MRGKRILEFRTGLEIRRAIIKMMNRQPVEFPLQRVRRSFRIASQVLLAFNSKIDEVFAAWASGQTKQCMEIEAAVSRLKSVTVEDLWETTPHQFTSYFLTTAVTCERLDNVDSFRESICDAIDDMWEQLDL